MIKRKKTIAVKIGNVVVGGQDNHVVVQSMTNTDTTDITSTTKQIIELINAGSELVRITVNNEEAAKAVPKIKENLQKQGMDTPIVGDFHYNGHILLSKYADCAKMLDKYRINPGNVGFGEKHDKQFATIIETAIIYNKAIRIGVNWGSLDKDLLANMMDENNNCATPKTAEQILQEAMIVSAINSTDKAKHIGLAEDRIIISCKTSRVNDLINVYKELAKRTNQPLHIGLTEAGMGIKGIVSSTAALAILLEQGIGDTIRVSLTPKPGEARTKEVEVAKEILQSLAIRSFNPVVSACPGCGRTTSDYFQHLALDIESYLQNSMPVWQKKYKGVEALNVAVMGCIVNGPGESKHADIGISLPGSGESPAAPVFIDGEKFITLRGNNIANDFKKIVTDYIENRFAS